MGVEYSRKPLLHDKTKICAKTIFEVVTIELRKLMKVSECWVSNFVLYHDGA